MEKTGNWWIVLTMFLVWDWVHKQVENAAKWRRNTVRERMWKGIEIEKSVFMSCYLFDQKKVVYWI